jgi:altronate hydrolase
MEINLRENEDGLMQDDGTGNESGRRDAWLCHAADSVAIALHDLKASSWIEVGDDAIRLPEAIDKGHKLALRPHTPGETIIRYGMPIGRATAPIAIGAHVHSHNLATALGGERDYGCFAATPPALGQMPALGDWRGYRREDGRFATRNEIWVLPTVGCVAPLVETVAREAHARHAGLLDAVVGFGHPHGCSQLGDDLSGTRALLAALCDNPNAGGVVLVGLGCESNQLDELLAAIPARSHAKLRMMRAQDAGDERERLLALVAGLAQEIGSLERETAPASALTIGLKCGGSDALSGLTANPLLGRFSDRLAAAGGSLVLTEIPEIFGAEEALLARSTSRETFEQAGALVNRFKRYFLDQGQPVSENPSPGNIAGGITTLEEKSLGAVQKGGSAPLVDVIDYGGTASRPGLTLLEAPGNDAISSTALAAAGATMILFTTGRGTPLGFPVPTMKIASNSALAAAKPGWIDYDAGRVLTEGTDAVDEDFGRCLLATASGRPTAAETGGQRAIAIWKRGVTL